MTYTKIIFLEDTPLNISNLNILGSQYNEMKSLIESHNHNDDYYLKTECDNKYIYENNDGEGSNINANTIDGYNKAALKSTPPNSLLIFFAGNLNNLNSSWHLADGSNGTVDCINKYIIGANNYTFHNQGGNDVFSPTINIMIGNHTLTIPELPSHDHTWIESNQYFHPAGTYNASYIDGIGSSTADLYSRFTSFIGGGNAHTHENSYIVFNEVDNRPLTKCLYLIQKI